MPQLHEVCRVKGKRPNPITEAIAKINALEDIEKENDENWKDKALKIASLLNLF